MKDEHISDVEGYELSDSKVKKGTRNINEVDLDKSKNEANKQKESSALAHMEDIILNKLPFPSLGTSDSPILPIFERDPIKKKQSSSKEEFLDLRELFNKDTFVDALGTFIDPFTFGLGKKGIKSIADLFESGEELTPDELKQREINKEKALRRRVNVAVNEWLKLEEAKKMAQEQLKYLNDSLYKYKNGNSPYRTGESVADAKSREEMANYIDTLVRNDIVPDDFIEIVKKARDINVPPSLLLYSSRENIQTFDAAIKRKSLKIGGVDTPITTNLFKDPDIAMRAYGNIEYIQQLERSAHFAAIHIKREQFYNEFKRLDKQQSTGVVDNLIYGMASPSIAARLVRDYASGKIDDLNGFIYSLFASKEDAERFNAINERTKNKREEELVKYSQIVANLPRDMRANNIGEKYKKNGLLAAIVYAAQNTDIALTTFYQEAPTSLLSLGIGKVATKPMEVMLKKTAINKVTQQRIKNLTTASITAGTQSAVASYPNSLVDGYNRTGNYRETIERANTRAFIEGTAGLVSGVVPDVIKKTSLPKDLLNIYAKNQIQTGIGMAGNTTASYVLGEEIDTSALVANAITNQISFPVQVAKDYLGRQIHADTVANWRFLNRNFQTIKKMPIREKDPETAVKIIEKVNDETGIPLEKIYVPLSEIIKYADKYGLKPNDLVEKLTGKKELFDYVQNRGIDVPIPIAKYSVYIGFDKGAEESLNSFIRTSPDSVSPYEFIRASKQLSDNQKNFLIDADSLIKEQVFLIKNDEVFKSVFKQGIDNGLTTHEATQQALIYHSLLYNVASSFGIKTSDLLEMSQMNLVTSDNINGIVKNKIDRFISSKDGQLKINLDSSFESSSLLDNTGEFVISNLANMKKMASTDKALAKDIRNIEKLLGTNDLGSLSPEQQQQFTQYVNRYLNEGVVPNRESLPTFRKLRKVFINAYTLAKQLNLKIDDETSQTFERLVLADNTIELINAANKPVFENAQTAGMTDAQYQKYMNHYSQSKEQAKEAIFDGLVKEKETKQWQEARKILKEEMREEVNNEPIYQLTDALTKGALIRGTKIRIKKIDQGAVIERYGKEVANKLKHLTTDKDGTDPEKLAQIWGYAGADEMIGLLYSAPERESLINIRTDAVMNRRYGENPNYSAMNDRAYMASENETRAKFLQKEAIQLNNLRLLHKTKKDIKRHEQYYLDDTIMSDEVLKNVAKQLVLVTKSFELEPTLYLMAGRKANEQAYLAAKKQDWKKAFEEKEKERFNHFLYLAALEGIK